jgi:hypothetical protein
VTRGTACTWGMKGSSARPHVTHATTKKSVCPIFQFSGFLPYINGFLLIFLGFWPKRVDIEPRKRLYLGGKLDLDPQIRIYINQRFLIVQTSLEHEK